MDAAVVDAPEVEAAAAVVNPCVDAAVVDAPGVDATVVDVPGINEGCSVVVNGIVSIVTVVGVV